jgi:serine/threonine protein kinase/WD40 repeat protein
MSNDPATCPDCGAPRLTGGRHSLCPRCLLKVGMSVGADDEWMDDPFDCGMAAPREAPGTVIGRYTLHEEIGEGGFGIVYLAEQAAPVKRKVALKILKPGMDTREVVARFRVERQALALMDHPHIAQVYDGGATDSGRPYFVMELVNGTPITSYCADRELTTRQRLELFLDVTSAVQHAHQKGIIHRDLKPSNILVSSQDGKPVVKVIDFGIAKAVSMELTGTTVMTAFGRMIGTPEYMSPEQAELNVLDVDTRSDIYSLGVLIYELLTGTTPLDPLVLRRAGFTEMQRMIREEKPLNPSARIAARRQQDLRGNPHRTTSRPGEAPIGRELDWVVMQALEKDRSRRYQTANGLGLDVRRFLDDEPVSASPPSATYRFTKFAKRHRVGVAWTVVFTAVVIAAGIGMTVLYFDAGRKAQLAREQRAEAEMERGKAVDAGDIAQSRTWEARLSEAAALRWSGKPERRFLAFDALREAAAITSEHDEPGNLKRLRDSAIACLAIVDMRPIDSWKGNPGYGEMVSADAALVSYATTFPDGRISIRRYPEKNLLLDLPGGGEPVGGVLRFSPDGGRLAAAYGRDSVWKLKLWNARSAAPAIDGGAGVNRAFAFFPDGKRCAVGRPDGNIAVIDAESGKELRRHELTDVAHAVGVSRRGRWLAVGMAGRVEVIDAETGVKLAALECPARAVAWSPAEDSLAVGCADGVLRLWYPEGRGSAAFELEGHTKGLDAVAWSPDGRLLASQGLDGTIRLWDPFQGTALSWHPGRGSDLGFSADGTRLGMLREGQTLTVMEVEPGDVCYRGRKHSGAAGVVDGAWNAAGTLMATSGDDGVRLWNREGRQMGFLNRPQARGVVFSAESLIVASAAGLHRWQVKCETMEDGLSMTLQEPEAIGSFHACGQISLSNDESLLALAGRRGDDEAAVWLVDLKNHAAPKRLAAPPGVAYCAISRDGRWLAAGTRKGDGVRVWPLDGGTAPVDLPIHGSAKVAFSPDGKWFVTGDTEAYRFWEPGSWALKREIPSQMGDSTGLMAFSPRMTALIIACRGAELKVLNPFTLEELSAPDFDRESPLCFDPNGRLMITTGQSGGLFFWKLDAVRSRLVSMGLDWNHMRQFPELILPVVKRVVVPDGGS